MAAKVAYSYAVSGKKGSKSAVLGFFAELQEKAQHKWIPIEEMTSGKQATLTPRQADWMVARVEKNIEGAELSFTIIPQEAEAEA